MESTFAHPDRFVDRHIGPRDHHIPEMLQALGFDSMDAFMDRVIPKNIRTNHHPALSAPMRENELLAELRDIARQNKSYRSLIGLGYHGTITPTVIRRNVLENPGWYTQYTPYQAEIAQGRLEALLNFQTMITDLTGMTMANASLLDEGTAAAEAMTMFQRVGPRQQGATFFVSEECHPQTIDVVKTRAVPLNINVVVGDHRSVEFSPDIFGVLVAYPASDGAIYDYRNFCDRAHAVGALVVVAADILSLALLTPPGEFGADAVVGSTQRFGLPMGYGGPHAAYFATHESYKRQLPGRIIGISQDSQGKTAYRMALQTREQHIRREKATSNICTAQALLAIIAGFYATYHGPDGIRQIAVRVHTLTRILMQGLQQLGYELVHVDVFDTIRVKVPVRDSQALLATAAAHRINFRQFADGDMGITLDEVTDEAEVNQVLQIFALTRPLGFTFEDLAAEITPGYHGQFKRTSAYLTHPVFNQYHSETDLLRYLKYLENRDLSLAHSMIPLGSCTMKLNATTEMIPITIDEFADIHPFAPVEQAAGYHRMFQQLESWLIELTGFDAFSFQPNAGAQGEYAGLSVIRAYHQFNGDSVRDVCLIPASAHGTNPASAVMAGMNVVVVECDENGNIDLADLKTKAEKHSANLAAIMITYPSTHGVFEETIREICDIIHQHGGQVYLDGANMNAQLGLCRPGEYGADVTHLNMHKTFSIPHGGGGPGMGPIGVRAHLAPFLPGHAIVSTGGKQASGPVSAAPYGSSLIMFISWAYIAMMGAAGLTKATQVAILNANYMAKRLENHYPILYRGTSGFNAHEFILDFRHFKKCGGIEVEDVAKRLMDYGFHAPTVSFPVAGTLMVEPTESESKEELDRFCDALLAIREEIAAIENGAIDAADNWLKNAPHSIEMVAANEWAHPYTREQAAFPSSWSRVRKFWPPVGRIDNAYGDRNLVCACLPISAYED